ncbi:MAG: geranylgeranylglyceryl/heptaprenylglyceryl phosphate synthase [Candidatus Aenigmatarchaeota archaeon]
MATGVKNGKRIGKVERYILDKIEREGGILLSLIDPDSQPFEKGAKVAEASCEAGADVILVGGSIGAQGLILDKTTKMIRERVNVPIVLFPGNVGTITPYADAMYFMYVLNSREVYWMSTVQIQGAPVVKRMGIEPIPTGYIILEPGKAVGWISNANLIPRNRGDLAAATALAAQYMGAHFIVTDSGSGAETPAPPELVAAVKSQLSVPYFYAGGCKTADQARAIIKAGADGIQIGTAFEIEDDVKKVTEKVAQMKAAIKEAGRDRVKKGGWNEPKSKSFLPIIRVPRMFKLPAIKKPDFSKDDIKDTLKRFKEKRKKSEKE